MMRQPNSLKWRLGLWVFLPIVLISCVDLLITYRRTEQVATLVQEQLLKGSARIISEQLVAVDGGYEISIPPAALELFASTYQDMVFYSVRGKDGQLIAGEPSLQPYAGRLQPEQAQYFLSTVQGETVRIIAYAQSLPNQDGEDYAVTQVAQTLQGYQAFHHDLFVLTIRDHLITLVIVILSMVVTLRWTLRPLTRFTRMLLRRRPGSLETVEEQNAPAELQPLVHAINDYVLRLDQALSSYEQFVSNTAHQLRTSFAIISSQLNFAQRSIDRRDPQQEVLRAIQKTVEQGTRVINQLLVLAAVDRNRQLTEPPPPVRLYAVVKQTIDALALLAQQSGIDLGIDELDESLEVAAPPHLLGELASNLIDNAIQHAGPGAAVTVSLRRAQAMALLVVTDNGPGIPAAQRDRVFERFFRIDSGKPNSSGLGLAIVKEISETLKATISLSTAAGDRGLRVEVVIPLVVA